MGRYTKSEKSRLHTHTVSSMSIATAPNDNESAREREREKDSLCTWVRRRQAEASHDCERLLAFWRGDVHGEPGSDLVPQWVCPERLYKRGAEVCWAGTMCAAAVPAK